MDIQCSSSKVAFTEQDRKSQDLIDSILCCLVSPDTSIAAMYLHTPLPCPGNPWDTLHIILSSNYRLYHLTGGGLVESWG